MQVDTNGECLVRGAGLMRGYLNKEKGTVFCASGQNNWYPTGDHVLLLKNEDVVFVGRKDNQVKISGHRVELGEIEAVIYRIPQVKQCKVLWQEEEQTLLAFCLANNGEVVIAEEVLKHCFTQLPKYMVPNHVIVLDEFPLTKNSKTDMEQLTQRWKQRRRKSAIVEGAETILGHAVDPNLGLFGNGATTYQAILTAKLLEKNGKFVNAAELLQYPLANQGDHFKVFKNDENLKEKHTASKRLRNIWAKVLKHDNFDQNDNFFLVGGHSLLLLKLRYELNQEFNTALGIQDLLNALVFCQMVEMLCTKKSNVKIVDLICSSPNPRKTLVFVHPLYGGSIPYATLIQHIRQREHYSVLTVQHPNTFGFESDDPKFFESVQSLARSYASEVSDLQTAVI
ncbi:unnamed protein product [Cylicostephanus goldi]|uniref:Carrier domain-containing protein n=1 Tax=Cylicostephanus goldi TaxID=71465 RepID=A0A3P7PWY5_CYLGO|nr:unnamed protein product [Cylicostephanus goldi]